MKLEYHFLNEYDFIKKKLSHHIDKAAAVALLIKMFASHAEGWLLESRPRLVKLAETGINSSTVKRCVTGVW